MKKIVVTGGAGYIGSKLVETLLNAGFAVVIIDNLNSGKKENIHKNASFYQEDISSPEISSIFQKEKPDMIYHLAALKSVAVSLSDPIGFAKTNVIGSLNILNCADRLGIKKVIFTSTAAVYGEDFYDKQQYEDQPLNPLSPYGASKLAIEYYINYYNKVKGMQGVVLRFANVYGPGGNTDYQGVINIFIEKVLNDKQLSIDGDGHQTRDFVSTEDIIGMCMHLASTQYETKTGKDFIFNVSTGKETSINEIVEMIASFTNKNPRLIYNNDAYSGQDKSILSPLKAQKILGWSAKKLLKDGIEETVTYYQKIYGK